MRYMVRRLVRPEPPGSFDASCGFVRELAPGKTVERIQKTGEELQKGHFLRRRQSPGNRDRLGQLHVLQSLEHMKQPAAQSR